MANTLSLKKTLIMSVRVPVLRRIVCRQIDRTIYNRVVETDTRFPAPMALKRYDFLSSLLAGVVRNLRRGYISPLAIERLTDVFVNNTLLDSNPQKREAQRAFEQKYGRGAPNFIVLSPTKGCNLRCEGCYASSDSDSSPSLDFDTVDRIVGEVRNLFGGSFVVLSGGEPLLYRSDGKTIFDLFRKYPDMFFMFYTNGTLITGDVAKELLEVGNASPAISVEGYEDLTDERRGQGVFMKILRAMRALRQTGVPFGISVTATSKNIKTLLSDEFFNYFFELQGASYAWQFQFMPIGRGNKAFDLMVEPADRVRLYRVWEHQIRDCGHAVADFWNSGVLTNGCIAYGGKRGYIYIDWNGNIMPCVFVPYYQHNVKQLYAEGKSLADALDSEMFRRGREWQEEYLGGRTKPKNMIIPCSIRDHFANFKHNILSEEAVAENPEAAEMLGDEEYHSRMTAYDREIESLTAPIWEREYLGANKIFT
ncbi:MAG: radical SAM protein [Tidjanibacter sp.]|nr:radical SAM protein [Tidjanibacter sp.]